MFTIPWIYDQNDSFEDPITFLNTTKYKHSSSNGNTRTTPEEPHLLRNTFFLFHCRISISTIGNYLD